MKRTPLDECFRIGGRTKWYGTPQDLQGDLHAFLIFYNVKRSHQVSTGGSSDRGWAANRIGDIHRLGHELRCAARAC
jgi:hypothetical protein